ncbi:hypothetical protein CBM2586_B130752 [Cupriavidus phytorum]|uniref:Transposase n=1 Tax=Cupriavidus taiwanensis TaxID=164546 RepID=A0A976AAS7_9BURK|nr:hypothetical protein CBM2586_B130752 [Cupriavidus taiwanensis]
MASHVCGAIQRRQKRIDRSVINSSFYAFS